MKTIVVLEGDKTGQELLEEALRALAPEVIGVELELPRFDLSLESRRATENGVVHQAAVAVKEKTQGNPLAAGVIAFGAGWLVSSMLPASEKETQLASKAVDTAKEYGQPLAREAADVTAEIGQDMKSPAQEAVQSVKSTAAEAASTVKDEGRSSAETVKEEVKPSS